LSTSRPQRERIVCNTTPVRYFALVGRIDLLVDVCGGRLTVPRVVFDPDEDPDLRPTSLLSEIGQSERYWAARSHAVDALEIMTRLRSLRGRTDIEAVDLDEEELVILAEVSSRRFARDLGLVAPLGRGEAAVIAIAENRGWSAVIDDRAGRDSLALRAPGVEVVTTRELLRASALDGPISSSEAEQIYGEMLARGYRGPASLWADA
jgi:predicted nucleic acid-binding protein